MTATVAQTVGIDISKHTLDVYLHPQAIVRQFANSAAAIPTLLARLQQHTISRVVFKPTGAITTTSSINSARSSCPSSRSTHCRHAASQKPSTPR